MWAKSHPVREPGGGEEKWLLAGRGHESKQKDQRKNHDARRSGSINQVYEHEHNHDQETQHGFSVMHRSQRDLAREQYGIGKRNKVEDHAQIGCV